MDDLLPGFPGRGRRGTDVADARRCARGSTHTVEEIRSFTLDLGMLWSAGHCPRCWEPGVTYVPALMRLAAREECL